MTAVVDHAIHEVRMELYAAQEAFPPYHGPHEGYAVIKEEVDELWDEVKKKREHRSISNLRHEAIQVAAMALRFVIDLCPREE